MEAFGLAKNKQMDSIISYVELVFSDILLFVVTGIHKSRWKSIRFSEYWMGNAGSYQSWAG